MSAFHAAAALKTLHESVARWYSFRMETMLDQAASAIGYAVMVVGGIGLVSLGAWIVCGFALEAGRNLVMTRDFYEYRRDRKQRRSNA